MLGWERQNKRHYHQKVEETDHYTSVSALSIMRKDRGRTPFARKKTITIGSKGDPRKVAKNFLEGQHDANQKNRESCGKIDNYYGVVRGGRYRWSSF